MCWLFVVLVFFDTHTMCVQLLLCYIGGEMDMGMHMALLSAGDLYFDAMCVRFQGAIVLKLA